MKLHISIFLVFLLIGCSSKKETIKEEASITQQTEQQIEPPQPPKTTTYKENSTLVSCLVDTLEIVDDYKYKITVKVITAIPDDWNVSIIEPEQIITVIPAYLLDENQNIDLQNPINAKLYELRNLKKKGFFIGKVTLARDNNYYITKVEAWQNPPEE
ncbi:MAG: hypothetical protein IGBAC_0779 [Ignavibacteriae bacterium]|nr:MAG: hypothetical protein IGBAC_0779 [Ignavibacteriota bacterium]